MIHKYQFRDLFIVLDVNSGAVHTVSRLVYDILDRYPRQSAETVTQKLAGRYPADRVSQAISDIDALADEGMLFSDDSHITLDMLEHRDAVVKAMCLHVAHDCNMRCRYCFGDTGAFEGARGLLDLDTGKKAVDFLLARSGSRQNLEIDFFGGEPLMNFEVVKALVAYGRERENVYGKNIRFTITTNGLLLDAEKEVFINEHMDNVILSIDGRPEINDRMRKSAGGGGTYRPIIGNYLRFRDRRRGTYYVRGTFTAENLDFTHDVRHLTALGFPYISVEPVVADETEAWALKEAHLPQILAEYDRLTDFCLQQHARGEPFTFFHFNMDLSQGPCVVKRISGCGAGTEYVAVSPEGDIYPCHQFVGNPAWRIGSLHDTAFDNHLYDAFNRAHIYNKEACRSCWAKFYCSGGCHANAIHASGDLLQPYPLGCELERKRVECAVGIQAVLHSGEIE